MASHNNETNEKRYKAPALEKGLDVLELLARHGEPLTTSQIANKLGRSVSELFRMVLTLESREYISQFQGKEGYGLTNKLFSLGLASAPTHTLIEAALPKMKQLATEVGQSCHLVVLSNDQIVVVARVENPRDLSFSVRVGYRRQMIESTSGVVLCALQESSKREAMLEALEKKHGESELKSFREKVDNILRDGHIHAPSEFVHGVKDLSSPIVSGGEAVASLSIPYIQFTPELCSEEEALLKLIECTKKISELYITEQ